MSDKKQLHVILTMPYRTNRSHLARMLATYLTEKGLTVDISQVPVVDIEPPVNVEKGPTVQQGAVFFISEHQLGRRIVLEPGMENTGERISRPAVPVAMPQCGHGIAVIGFASSGKSLVMKLMSECLNTNPLTKELPQSITTLGDEPLPLAWQAEQYAAQVKDRIEVIFHVRLSKAQSSLEEILDGCDKPQVAEE